MTERRASYPHERLFELAAGDRFSRHVRLSLAAVDVLYRDDVAFGELLRRSLHPFVEPGRRL